MNEKKKYTIVCFIDKLSFPLREALRKQIWWLAEKKHRADYQVTIKIFSDEKVNFSMSGIIVEYFDRNSIINYKFKSDIVHYITSVVELRLAFSLLSRGEKYLTIGDGEPLSSSKVTCRKILIKFLASYFDRIYIYSKYQKNKLGINKAEIIEPILPVIHGPSKSKHFSPTILYMGHLSLFKGVDSIFFTFSKLIKEIPTLRLVIADNMVHSDAYLLEELNCLKTKYPDNVVIKGIVNPVDELSEAWVYIYPFIKPGGTLSYALSLFESIRCGTPFIACDVGANSEFFPSEYLIPPHDREVMLKKCRELLRATK